MNFICQSDAIDNLKYLSLSDIHSIIIEGVQGCGKTYLASYYANLRGVENVVSVNPSVSEIKSILEECYKSSSKYLICIENLDLGVKSASYSLLKFIEEPTSNVYVVVTCRNLLRLPETIPSRCATVSIAPPTKSDIELYAVSTNNKKFSLIRNKDIWKCVGTFKDVLDVFNLSDDQLLYFESDLTDLNVNSSVSSITWNISHFKDGSECPLLLVVKYLMNHTSVKYLKSSCIDCLNELQMSRLSKNAILSKLVFEFKYGG